MDTKIFNNFVTYMGVYECLSRGPCTPNEVAKYLTNSMTSRNAAKHSKKAADGDLKYISLNKDEKLELDKPALIGFLLEFCQALHLEADIHTKKKQKPEDSIVSITNSHSKDFQDMKDENNNAKKTIKDLKKKISELQKEKEKAVAAAIISCMDSKVLVPASVKSEPKDALEENCFLATPEMQMDQVSSLSNDGGILNSMFDISDSADKELTESNYIHWLCKPFEAGKLFIKRLKDEKEAPALVEKNCDLDANRSKSVQLLLSNKSLSNQAKLATYAFWYFHDDPEMEELLRLAGRYGIHADSVIQLLEQPKEYRNYKTVRAFLQQIMMSSEAQIKMEAAKELLCGDWYVTADYCGKTCRFKLMPVEELEEFVSLLREVRLDEASEKLVKLLEWKSTCGQSDHKLEKEDIETPKFVKEVSDIPEAHIPIDEESALSHFEESEGDDCGK